MHHGNDAEAALTAAIDTALHRGTDAAEVVRLVREQGWLPLIDTDRPVDVVEGLLADGRRVPVRIYRASNRQLLAG